MSGGPSAVAELGAPDEAGPVRSVYVHVPFRARRTAVRDAAAHVEADPDAPGWLGAVAGEWRLLQEEGVAPELPVETLHVGGGDPALLGPEAMGGLARRLGPELVDPRRGEWTAEAMPGRLTAAVARGWREAGVDRLSLGVWSFDDGALRALGPGHDGKGARRAVESARKAGIGNLSIDLVFGLPPEVGRSWSRDLREAVALGIPHVSLHGLSPEEGTEASRRIAGGRGGPASEERYREEYLEAAELLREAGYRHYEVTSFALPGRESRHNPVYWRGRPYLGLGNGAHSYLPPARRWNLRDWTAYRSAVRKGERPVAGEEVPGPEERRLERLWLRLRTADGLPLTLLERAVGEKPERWIGEGWARIDGERLVLTPRGWLLLDRLVVELDAALPSS